MELYTKKQIIQAVKDRKITFHAGAALIRQLGQVATLKSEVMKKAA